MHHVISFVCLVVTIHAVTSSPVSLEETNSKPINLRVIKEDPNPRHKRSTLESNLPDHLEVGVPFEDSDVILRLKRSKLIPTITSDGWHESVSQEAAVYTDLSRDSAMIVRRKNNDYTLQGTFHHKDKDWNLEPLTRNSRSTQTHTLSPLTAKKEHDVISFAGDEYFLNDEDRIASKPTTSDSHRHKRDVTQHVIEIAFIVDYLDYTNWVNFVGSSNAISEINIWYTYVADSINIRYNSIQDSEIEINTRTNVLKVITRSIDNDFIDDIANNDDVIDGFSGLVAFRSWVEQQGDVPRSDHYMLFTGYDIGGATGIAFGSAVCSRSSVSISENTFQGTLGGIAAHELGHSLSAIHDVDEVGCSDVDQFVMSSVLSTPVDLVNEGNPWKFSSCSVAKFRQYLGSVTCTLPEDTSGIDVLPAPSSGQTAGEVLSLDQQCRFVFQDDSSRFCQSVQIQQGGLQTLCGGMYCLIPGRNGVCQTALPQEFSPCGSDKWCVLGQCVDVTTPAPTTTTTTTTPEPTTTTTTTTTPEPTTTTTTTTTTTPAPTTTTTTTTPEPTTTTTTTTPAPTTTTTTTTPAPTTTTTTTTVEPTTPTTTPTTTTTTKEPTTTAATTTREPTTTTTTTTTLKPTTKPTTTTTTAAPTRPATTKPATTTTILPTTPQTTTTTTTQTTTTTTEDNGPKTYSDCFRYLYRDWNQWWQCVRQVYYRQRRLEMEERRRQEQQRKEEQKRREEQRRQDEKQRKEERKRQREQERKNNQQKRQRG